VPRDLKVVCANVGPLSTKEFLSDPKFIRLADKLGERAIEKVMEQPTPEAFMCASREFADELGLLDDELRGLIRAAESAGAMGASQVMIGKAVFALARGSKAKRVSEVLSDILSSEQVMVARVSQRGAKLL
jgi:pantoate kinase